MNPMTIAIRQILATLLAGCALAAAGATFAQVYVAPQPRYEEPYSAPAPGVSITLGMHGDRYWDGNRYWEHDEWMHRHPHERDPWREHRHWREHMHEHEHGEY
ncbi:hypothetical protein [Burkholderia sp. BCC1977]|uniref:hypothetical protein n=1 Tax=Burkholderia sp. BCC1977 TaxID=2817440 RepID=UPI002ABD5BAD|nr:hypothetical protein [Burkholderia sp. BCC1977]